MDNKLAIFSTVAVWTWEGYFNFFVHQFLWMHEWVGTTSPVSFMLCDNMLIALSNICDTLMFFKMCMGVLMHICVSCGYSAHGGQKRILDLLRQELQTVVSHHMGAGSCPRTSGRTTSALNCGAMSPVPHLITLLM